jgi:hypothetical protein
MMLIYCLFITLITESIIGVPVKRKVNDLDRQLNSWDHYQYQHISSHLPSFKELPSSKFDPKDLDAFEWIDYPDSPERKHAGSPTRSNVGSSSTHTNGHGKQEGVEQHSTAFLVGTGSSHHQESSNTNSNQASSSSRRRYRPRSTIKKAYSREEKGAEENVTGVDEEDIKRHQKKLLNAYYYARRPEEKKALARARKVERYHALPQEQKRAISAKQVQRKRAKVESMTADERAIERIKNAEGQRRRRAQAKAQQSAQATS